MSQKPSVFRLDEILTNDREKQWKKNPQKVVRPAVVQVDFMTQTAVAVSREGELAAAGGRPSVWAQKPIDSRAV